MNADHTIIFIISILASQYITYTLTPTVGSELNDHLSSAPQFLANYGKLCEEGVACRLHLIHIQTYC